VVFIDFCEVVLMRGSMGHQRVIAKWFYLLLYLIAV